MRQVSGFAEEDPPVTANYLIFLDDERDPPASTAKSWGVEVVVVRTVAAFKDVIEARGEPFMAQFDWYLGVAQPDGLVAAQWLIEYDRQHNILTQDFMFDSHSSEPLKAREIVRLLWSYMQEKFPP